MRHLRRPRSETIRIIGIIEMVVGLILALIWVSRQDALYLVLAAALVIVGIATALSARPGLGDPQPDDRGEPDTETTDRPPTISLDRSMLPGETGDDNRADIDPALVPTLEDLVVWLDEHDYLPVDHTAPRASWTLRLRGRRLAVLDTGGDVHYLPPADTALAAGCHVTAQYRRRG